MKVSGVVVFLDGTSKTFKDHGYIHPGGRICGGVHDGTLIRIDERQEHIGELTYTSMRSGLLIAHLPEDIQAKFKIGNYCTRKA